MAAKNSASLSPDPGQLLAWYDQHARTLPWRAPPGAPAPDAYRVWLSEIMLQQTTVAAVIPFYLRFLDLWPTVQDLAAAPQSDILAAWAGLGYYSRARNLHACAVQVVTRHGGKFPRTEADLRKLPGIGAYTAAAIAAIAFGGPAVVVDGNVERVTARLFRLSTPLPALKSQVRDCLAPIIPADRPGDFAQAMMDLGATVCTPRTPDCKACPWQTACAAHARGESAAYPVRRAKVARPERYGLVYWLVHDESVLLVRRPPKGLLGGMLALPGSDWTEEPPAQNWPGAPAKADWRLLPEAVRHVFTHFALTLRIARVRISDRQRIEGQWTPLAALPAAGLPSLYQKVVRTVRTAADQSPGSA